MKFTKLQRHTAYIIMLAEIESCSREFMCHIIEWDFGFGIEESCMQEFFPELFAKKPKGAGYAWFKGTYEHGRNERIELLTKCIAETA